MMTSIAKLQRMYVEGLQAELADSKQSLRDSQAELEQARAQIAVLEVDLSKARAWGAAARMRENAKDEEIERIKAHARFWIKAWSQATGHPIED